MNLFEHRKKPMNRYMGLYVRGDDDDVPSDHFQTAQNIEYFPGSFRTRKGSSIYDSGFVHGGARTRYFEFIGSAGNIGIFSMDANGNFWGPPVGAISTFYNPAVPLINVPFAIDFSAVQFYDKLFVTFHDGNVGIGVVYMWDNANATFRTIGWPRPSAAGPMLAADGAVTGATDVEIGTYKIAVVYETDSGYLTPPGPLVGGVFTPTIYVAPGGKKINLSNIPVDTNPGNHIVKRHIIITHADGAEYFFIDNFGGLISDNVTTTATLDFFNTDLIESADYLFDVRESVPCGTGIAVYAGRLVIWGFDEPDGSLARFSNAGEPETFDQTLESVIVNKDDGYAIRAGGQVRDQFYFFKDIGIYGTSDSGDDPVNWDTYLVEKGIGSFIRGLSTVSSTAMVGTHNDILLVADRSGLYIFNGMINYPDITWKINDYWRANVDFTKVNPIVDITTKRIYIAGISDGSILVGDYTEGISFDKIKWSTWILPSTVTCAAVVDVVPNKPQFTYTMASQSLNIFYFNPTRNTDFDGITENPINSIVIFGGNTFIDGYINLLVAIKLRASGNGIMKISVIGYDALTDTNDFNQSVIGTLNFGDRMHRDIQFMSRFMSEKFYIKIENLTDNIPDSNFWISKMIIFGDEFYASRPPMSN